MLYELTPWFKRNQRPVHIGIYLRDYGRGVYLYCRWDGTHWHSGNWSVVWAKERDSVSRFQNLPWRGIVSIRK